MNGGKEGGKFLSFEIPADIESAFCQVSQPKLRAAPNSRFPI